MIERAHILCVLLAHMMTSSNNGLNVPFFVSLYNFTCERPGLTAVSAVGDRDRDILLDFSCQHHAANLTYFYLRLPLPLRGGHMPPTSDGQEPMQL